MVDLYIIVALSFALASLFFIHRRALGMFNIKNGLLKDIVWVLSCTVFFPLILVSWLITKDNFIKTYGEAYHKGLDR